MFGIVRSQFSLRVAASKKAPKENAIKGSWSLRSLVTPPIAFCNVSNAPRPRRRWGRATAGRSVGFGVETELD
jgi:hypothetical protein